MSQPLASAGRRGFTLIELLIVITVILVLASMMLGLRASNPEGLANGQRMVANMIRIARVQAMMNRAAVPKPPGYATTSVWSPTNFRYRLLIKCDPTNPDTHLREMVIAIGCTGLGASSAKYVWFSPEPPVRLPPGVFFVPPNLAAAIGTIGPNPAVSMPGDTTLSGTSAATRLSRIPALADTTGLTPGTYEFLTPSATQAPVMLYRPINTPIGGNAAANIFYSDLSAVHGTAAGGRAWYYVELGPDGTNNHLGKVVLVVAEGANTGSSVLLTSPDKFAAVLVRRNGDVSLTSDTEELEAAGTSTLLK